MKDQMNPTASLSVLVFEDDWLNKPSDVLTLTDVDSSCGPLPASPSPSPSTWQTSALHCLLSLAHLQAVSTKQASSVTDQPELWRSL